MLCIVSFKNIEILFEYLFKQIYMYSKVMALWDNNKKHNFHSLDEVYIYHMKVNVSNSTPL